MGLDLGATFREQIVDILTFTDEAWKKQTLSIATFSPCIIAIKI